LKKRKLSELMITLFLVIIKGKLSGNMNKGKGNGAGLAWGCQSHCFADKFAKPYTHSFGTDTQHDYSQGNWRTMLSITDKLK